MKTYSAKAAEIEKKWVLIDAKGLVVGRLAAHPPIANNASVPSTSVDGSGTGVMSKNVPP